MKTNIFVCNEWLFSLVLKEFVGWAEHLVVTASALDFPSDFFTF